MSIPEDIRATAETIVSEMEWIGDSPRLSGLQDAIAEALMAERTRCAMIADAEYEKRFANIEGYPASRVHDFIVVARAIEEAIRSPDTGPST